MEENTSEIRLKKWKGINPKKEPLTITKLREFMSEDLEEGEAQEILFAIDAFANILIEFQSERDQHEKENNDYKLNQAA